MIEVMRPRWTICLAVVLIAATISFTALGRDGGESRGSSLGYSLAGQFLVASDKIGDPRFARTVIYMIDHDANGAMGLIVNRAMGSGPLSEFLNGLDIDGGNAEGTISVHYGGPVSPGQGFVLHTDDFAGENTILISGGMAMSVSPDVLKAVARGQGPRRFIFALGYSGWAAGQLESEMARDDWLTAPADPEVIFDNQYDSKWERASGRAGIRL